MKSGRSYFCGLFFLTTFWMCVSGQFALAETQNFSLNSKILNETRNIVVHLPDGYDEKSKQKYSALYMLDEGNDDVLTAKTVRNLHVSSGFPSLVVVAISNIRRAYDFMSPHELYGSGADKVKGNGDSFAAFIKEELIPETETRFNLGRKKIFMGHSWGGAFATYFISESSGLFDGFLIFSPAFGTSKDATLSALDSSLSGKKTLPKFIYVSVGGDEGADYTRSYVDLTTHLKKLKSSNAVFKFEVTEGAGHMSNPEQSIENALQFAGKYLGD